MGDVGRGLLVRHNTYDYFSTPFSPVDDTPPGQIREPPETYSFESTRKQKFGFFFV
jgi:hypothetical protein